MQSIGWLSAALLSLCGLPLAVSCVRSGRAEINAWFIWMWTIGELLGTVYVLYLGDMPLLANYLLNSIVCLTVLRYKLWPRR